MSPLKQLLPIIILLSIDGVFCRPPGSSQDHLLGSSSDLASVAGSSDQAFDFSSLSLAVPVLTAEDEFKRLFDVALDPIPAGNSMEKGSCAAYKQEILTAYHEALAMVHAAIEAIDELRRAPAVMSKAQKERYQRLQLPFADMFGIAASEAGYFQSLSEIREHYQSILTAHKLELTEKGPKFHIRCGDDFLQWKGPNDQDPRFEASPGRVQKKVILSNPPRPYKEYPNGAWYAVNMPDQYMLLAPNVQNDQEPSGSRWKSKTKSSNKDAVPQRRICDEPGAHAVSFAKEGLLVFCQILRGNKAGSSFNDWLHVSAGADEKIKKGVYFDDYGPTLAHIWLHHMFHYGLKWTEGVTQAAGSPSHVLGYIAAEKVVQKNRKQALSSPENYAVYAAAVHLSGWVWTHQGRLAQKVSPHLQVTGSSSGSSKSDPFKDPPRPKEPFRDPSNPSLAGSNSGSSGSGNGGRYGAM